MEDSEGPVILLVSWSPTLHMSNSLPDALSISSRASAMSPQQGWLTFWENHLLTCTEAAITQPLPPVGKEGAWLNLK